MRPLPTLEGRVYGGTAHLPARPPYRTLNKHRSDATAHLPARSLSESDLTIPQEFQTCSWRRASPPVPGRHGDSDTVPNAKEKVRTSMHAAHNQRYTNSEPHESPTLRHAAAAEGKKDRTYSESIAFFACTVFNVYIYISPASHVLYSGYVALSSWAQL